MWPSATIGASPFLADNNEGYLPFIRIGIAAAVFLAVGAVYKAKLVNAARAQDLPRIAVLRRVASIAAIIFWVLIGVWMYYWPQYEGWILWASWVVLPCVILYNALELKRSASVEANQRLIERLLAERKQ